MLDYTPLLQYVHDNIKPYVSEIVLAHNKLNDRPDDIVDLLSNEITEDINRNFIKKDVVEFLNALQSEKFLEVIDGGK